MIQSDRSTFVDFIRTYLTKEECVPISIAKGKGRILDIFKGEAIFHYCYWLDIQIDDRMKNYENDSKLPSSLPYRHTASWRAVAVAMFLEWNFILPVFSNNGSHKFLHGGLLSTEGLIYTVWF